MLLKEKLLSCKEEKSRYCLTTDCVLTTYDILRRMDQTVDPCHDFWLYSCGGWLRDNRHQPVAGDSWGVDDEAKASVGRHIRSWLQIPAVCDDEHMTTECKMRLLYARCMDTETIDAIGAQPLQDILDELGGWSALGLYYVQLLLFTARRIARCCRNVFVCLSFRLIVCHTGNGG